MTVRFKSRLASVRRVAKTPISHVERAQVFDAPSRASHLHLLSLFGSAYTLMSSSLAAQLAQSASLNSTQLLERTRRKPTESYLFSGKDANQHDLESLHALASSAFAQLKTLSVVLYQNPLWGGILAGFEMPQLEALDVTLLEDSWEERDQVTRVMSCLST